MKCNCIADVEKALVKKYSEELGLDAEVVTVDCLSSGFGMQGNKVTVIHKTDFRVTADTKGFKRGKLVPMIAAFCPFCGKATGNKKEE